MVDLLEPDEHGYIGHHRCPCCGYVCPRKYTRGFKSNGSLYTKTKKTQIFLTEVEQLLKVGMRGPEIAVEMELDLDTLYKRLRYNNFDMSRVKVKSKGKEFSEKFTELAEQGLTLRQIADSMRLSYQYVKDRSLKLGLRDPLPLGRK